MKRKLLSLLLVLAMVLAIFPASALAAGGNTVSEDGIAYRFEDDVAIVTGLADAKTTEVDIPELVQDKPVAGIDENAFKGTEITNVYIPESVEVIGDSAFENCTKLRTVEFSGYFADLGLNCFKGCESLTEMYVPETYTGVISQGTFEGCTNLEAVYIEYGNQAIEPGAFKGCENLAYIYLPVSVEIVFTQDFKELENVVVEGIAASNGGKSTAQKFADQMGFKFVADEYEECFDDVKAKDYYSVPVLWGAMNGVIYGYGDGNFGPDDNCTRAQMAAFLWRFNGCPEPAAEPEDYYDFCDVPADEYYTDAVQWAYENKIIYGTGKNKAGEDMFSPNTKVTRAMVVAMLNRMDNSPEATITKTAFTDIDTTDYYYPALLWGYENGVVAGTAADKFSPDAPCTRAQIVTFMYRNIYHFYDSYDFAEEFVA